MGKIILLFIIAAIVCGENKWYGSDTFEVKTTVNDRNVTYQHNGETRRRPNRNFSNIVQMGFTEGLLKVATGGKLDCTDTGMTILRGLLRLLKKMIYSDEVGTEMDARNAVELIWTLISRCNYQATL